MSDNPVRTWNHRVVRHPAAAFTDAEEYLQIHEVHYEDERPVSVSHEGARIGGDSIEEIQTSLRQNDRMSQQAELEFQEFHHYENRSPSPEIARLCVSLRAANVWSSDRCR